MRIIKQAERAWNKVYTDIPLPADWKILDRSFKLLPDEVQQLIAITGHQFSQASREQLALVHSPKDLHEGDRIRIAYTTGENIYLTVGKIENWIIRSANFTIIYNSDQMRIYKIKQPVKPPNPIEHPHIIDRHDGRAWVWDDADVHYIRIGDSATRDHDDFDDWEPARSVAADE